MPLQAGERLGAFEILTLIGSGGMGEVYRARDTKLNRDVAIKTLPAGVATDPERLARFQLEAQVLASLNHPNIAHIYGVEDSRDVHALVMELVDGPTLAERIAQGPIPLDDTLAMVAQIAHAIEAAHAQDVIHRDLKPANIKVRSDGTVKVLDFGLAKALAPGPPTASSGLSQLPTIASPGVTQVGMVLGTAAYMSPEQARGRAAGKPADVWAFGCVLFEMLTGVSAFAGETMSDTIAKTLGQEPDWKALPGSTPGKVRDVLRRCLRKEQQHRFQDIKDARLALEQAGTTRSRWQRSAATSIAAAALMLAIVLGSRWLPQKPSAPPTAHPPVTILIADFENRTNDSTFDRTVEPVLRISLENATFISAYDRTRINGTLGVRPPDRLDQRAALELAVKQGVNTVLSGSIEKEGDGYILSATATQTVTGSRIASATGRAATKDQIIQAAATVAATIRNALGDDTSDSTRLFNATTLSTTSLEVVRYYALAQEAGSSGKFEDALRLASRTVELDPKFGVGYQLLAVASQNMERHDDAVRYINEALRHLDGMTERERLTTRGMFFRLTGDYGQCEKEYKALSTRYPTDVIGYNQRALCLAQLRRMAEAVAEVRRAVELLPKRTIFRINLALYAGLAGEFQMAEREARTALEQDGNRGWGLLALGAAQEGQGLLKEAADSYVQLRKAGGRWASDADGALGELAMYEGRFAEASRIFTEGAAADVSVMNPDRAAGKLAVLGYLEFLRGRNQPAIAAIEKSLANSNEPGIRFTAARTLVLVGRTDRARSLMDGLASETQAESRAYGKIIEANLALRDKNTREAVRLLGEANDLLDIWIGHFDLGLAYLEDGKFAQADSEFDQCIKRRGEALSLFGDTQPAFGYFPHVHYHQGRAREGLKTVGFAESYRRYLEIRATPGEDPLLPDVRRRAGL
jgi:serine/threonine protein kinase/tetratricopeptide (TPR) repeat protein